MATTAGELVQRQAGLRPSELAHLQRLLGSWSILADLSFSDLLLVVPGRGGEGTAEHDAEAEEQPAGTEEQPAGTTADPVMVVLGQMRPNNRSTVAERDLVGRPVPAALAALATRCQRSAAIVSGSARWPETGEALDVECVPVSLRRRVIAVLVRLSRSGGPLTLYEETNLAVFERLAVMVGEAEFPFPGEDVATEETPRVGDGFVVVGADGRIEFASPNAMNALHRMGVFTDPEGRSFDDLAVDASAVKWALATGRPVVEEVERRPDVIVLVHCIPLLARGEVTGAVILLRDVTDVRRLDRLLLSKDAAIREVHHRVKNNLQTISSLLSLQARRVEGGVGQQALREAERRVRSIAIVHEILSHEPADQVPFDEIVVPLVKMAEDSVVSSCPIDISVTGDIGAVPADVATPLAVTLAELLQNAVQHAFEADPEAAGCEDDQAIGQVTVTLRQFDGELLVEVRDNGRGLPDSFDLSARRSLGLSIVRDLVQGQLGGTITLASIPQEEGGGTQATMIVPRRPPPRN